MRFIKWLVKTNPFHLGIIALLYIIMFSWGEEGASDRMIAFPFVTLVLAVLVFGKYRYWKKVLKDTDYE
jgi:hypothetical protein